MWDKMGKLYLYKPGVVMYPMTPEVFLKLRNAVWPGLHCNPQYYQMPDYTSEAYYSRKVWPGGMFPMFPQIHRRPFHITGNK